MSVKTTFKTMDGVDVYTKDGVDVKLSTKANTSDVETELNKKANAVNVYTKAEVNSKLAEKANASNVYTKSEVNSRLAEKVSTTEMNTALAEKANQSAVNNSFTNVDNNFANVNAALAQKANASDVYTKSELPEAVSDAVDGIINAKLALITSDINHIVDNAVEDTLDDLVMTTTEATALVNTYF